MLFSIISLLLVALDQISKFATLKYLKPVFSIEVIKDILSFTYVENRGAAFGILQNARFVFIVFTIIAIAVLIWYKYKHRPQGILINTSLCLVLSGAVGNMIDRIFRGFVVDMIEVTFIDYPVFNVADCFVVVGTILMIIYILFVYKEPKKADQDDKI